MPTASGGTGAVVARGPPHALHASAISSAPASHVARRTAGIEERTRMVTGEDVGRRTVPSDTRAAPVDDNAPVRAVGADTPRSRPALRARGLTQLPTGGIVARRGSAMCRYRRLCRFGDAVELGRRRPRRDARITGGG